ncbi:hypothetical protein SDC9_88005 [bioreactor metagenome]|uniref:Uncharacterized protein n=1 Tax=bioreactor metagenome TaxID=1076179 RepID=A0A644ZKE2_9ZZZZ
MVLDYVVTVGVGTGARCEGSQRLTQLGCGDGARCRGQLLDVGNGPSYQRGLGEDALAEVCTGYLACGQRSGGGSRREKAEAHTRGVIRRDRSR